MQATINHKADRQAAKRLSKQGNRQARQAGERNLGPNIRVRELIRGDIRNGYFFTRLRDGKQVSKNVA